MQLKWWFKVISYRYRKSVMTKQLIHVDLHIKYILLIQWIYFSLNGQWSICLLTKLLPDLLSICNLSKLFSLYHISLSMVCRTNSWNLSHKHTNISQLGISISWAGFPWLIIIAFPWGKQALGMLRSEHASLWKDFSKDRAGICWTVYISH